MRSAWRLTAGDQRGAIFLASLVLVAVMTLLGVALFGLATIEAVLSSGDTGSTQLLYCAEGALGRTMTDTNRLPQMNTAYNSLSQPLPITWTDSVPLAANAGQPPIGTCFNTITFTDVRTPTRMQFLKATSTFIDPSTNAATVPNAPTPRTVRIKFCMSPVWPPPTC